MTEKPVPGGKPDIREAPGQTLAEAGWGKYENPGYVAQELAPAAAS